MRSEVSSPPIYLVFGPGPERNSVMEALEADGVDVEGVGDDWTGVVDWSLPGGIVLVGPDLGARRLVALLDEIIGQPGTWSVLLALPGPEGQWRGVPLSPGFPGPLTTLARGEAGGDGFRALLRQLARARHDINNPLTSALAEVQLLLMDGEGGPRILESLGVVQDQLRRIRDLVIGLARFRPPAS